MMGKSTEFLVVVVVCFAVAVCSVSAKVSQSCENGEESWCQNILIAKRCGAVKHCQTVWNGKEAKLPSCHVGQVFVKKAQLHCMQVHSNAAKLNAVAGLCDVLDDQTRETCKMMMVEAGMEVLDMINSTMRPAAIGNILGLCATTESKDVKKDGKLCTDCKRLLDDLQYSFTGPKVQERMKKQMELMCDQVPGDFRKMCLDLSDQWIKHFFLYINDAMRLNKICEFLNFCTPEDNKSFFDIQKIVTKFNDISSPLSDVTCRTCKQVMDDVRDLINSQSFQGEFEALVSDTLCYLMPSHLIAPCKRRVRKYGNLIFDIVIATFDAQVTCEAVRMCPQTEAGLKSINLKGKFMDVISKVMIKLSPSNMHLVAAFNLVGNAIEGGECTLCQLMFREVERMIGDDSSESQITTALNEACNLLPPPWADECSEFIKQNGKQIIDDILRNLPPREICSSFGLCSKDVKRAKRDTNIYFMSANEDIIKKPKSTEKVVEPKSKTGYGSPWCQICNQIAGIVQRILDSQQLEVGINTIYTSVCNVLPREFAFTCSHISKKVIDGVLGGLSTVAVPEVVCGAIGVCDMKLTSMNYSVPLPDALKPHH